MNVFTSVCPIGVLLSLTSTYCFWKQEVVMLGSYCMSTAGCSHLNREGVITGPSPGLSQWPQVQTEPQSRSTAGYRKPTQVPKSPPSPAQPSSLSTSRKTYFPTDHKGSPAFWWNRLFFSMSAFNSGSLGFELISHARMPGVGTLKGFGKMQGTRYAQVT